VHDKTSENYIIS